ncbi:hypothetical protein A2U01_0063401, partial [Trifolium medium]|nr:hypothetical protein [Trifolium medium]
MSASVRSNQRRCSGQCGASTKKTAVRVAGATPVMKEARRTSSSPSFLSFP